jgi:hypothetical protein
MGLPRESACISARAFWQIRFAPHELRDIRMNPLEYAEERFVRAEREAASARDEIDAYMSDGEEPPTERRAEALRELLACRNEVVQLRIGSASPAV